jgi:hypothetical protein
MDERERDLWGDDRETYCLDESDVYDNVYNNVHDNDNSLCHLSDEELSEMLVEAIKDNNFREIQRLVELNNISPNVYGCKPLEAVVETGNLELLKYLVEWGGNVNGTALMEVAIDNGEYDILCYLATKVKKERWDGILERAVRAKKNALHDEVFGKYRRVECDGSKLEGISRQKDYSNIGGTHGVGH